MTSLSAPRVATLAALFLAMTAVSGCTTYPGENTTAAPTFAEPFAPIDAARQNAEMGRGVNVLGYDPVWTDPAKARFTPGHFKIIRDGGFKTVRVVLQSFDHMDSSNQLDPQWLGTLDKMVKAALGEGLNVILDEHDFDMCGKDAAGCRVKLNEFWSQIAPRYKDAPGKVMFEILNEPNRAMTPELWNTQLHETLAIIRSSNPTRNVIIGPGNWNGLEQLAVLDLPADDQHIIVTFHYYHPMEFTHQGASWVEFTKNLSGVTWGTVADYALLNKELDQVKDWSVAHSRPIFMGEFGAYENGAMADRVRWTSAVARAAEARGFSWAYWYFDQGFTVYDIDKQAWVEPIKNALIPPAN